MLVTTLLVLLCVSYGVRSQTLIRTENGKLEGSFLQAPNRKNVTVYFGIPYAKPPVGELRFQAPKEADAWKGTFQAKQQSKPCIQADDDRGALYPQFEVFVSGGTEASEDCLYLNIWVPVNKPPEGAAVIIYVHGGSNKYGSGSIPMYDGSILASEEQVIVVNFNYRVGLFGYLFGDDDSIPGNMASMDQAMAFKWVQKNIIAFGGDPSRVTIVGQSTGGSAVTVHPLLPSSKGLFHRVIAQSDTIVANRLHFTKKKSLKRFKALCKAVGCNNSAGHIAAACLRSKSVEELVNASNSNRIGYSLTVDGKYFQKHPRDLIKEGIIDKSIEFLVGLNSGDAYQPSTIAAGAFKNESDYFLSETEFQEDIRIAITGNSSDVEKLQYMYTNGSVPNGNNYRNALLDFLTDTRYTCITNEFSDLVALNGNPVFRYRYSYVANVSKLYPWQEVAHSYELYSIFGHPLNPALGYSRRDALFSKKIMNYWASFAKYGNPNGKDLTNIPQNENWPSYTFEKKENFVLNDTNSVVNGLSLEKCNFLEKVSYRETKI